MKKPYTIYYILYTLFILAFLERTVFDLGPNFELITAAMILASFYAGKKQAFWLTLAIIAVTDRLTGNSSIFIFTWTGFLIPVIFMSDLIKNSKLKNKNLPVRVMGLTTGGLASNLFFYLWTNFGVWALDSWGMYSNNISGLVMSYINGLPFLKYHLTSTLIFVPVGFVLIEVSMLIYNQVVKKYSIQQKFIEHMPSSKVH